MFVRHAIRNGRVLRCLAAAGLVAGATMASAVALPGSALAADDFAPASSATIHPGVMLESPNGQCTANFVYTSGSKVYLGQAAHCTGTGSSSDTDGCKSTSTPLGTEIAVEGASKPGKLAYNSWLTMQDRGETDTNLCAYNDFALVEIDSEDVSKVNPTVPHFGGPNGLRTGGLAAGEQVFSYGNSGLRQGIGGLSPKQGINLGDGGEGRTHLIATITPGVPGDSGSGYLDSEGRAFGVLSTLNLAPAPGTNGVSDLAKALDYANSHGDVGEVNLERGTEAFHGSVLPLPALGSAPSGSGDGGQAGTSEAAPGDPVAVNPKHTDPGATGDEARQETEPGTKPKTTHRSDESKRSEAGTPSGADPGETEQDPSAGSGGLLGL